jgi:hypothetical protein
MIKLYEILVILILFFLGTFILKLLGDQRFKHEEGFDNEKLYDGPDSSTEVSQLSPDITEEGPSHLLKDKIEISRPMNEFGTLTQQQCWEQDGHTIPQKLGDYNQRTNNYIHTYPDTCNSPYKELVGSFYTPREGAIGSPIPKGLSHPESLKCVYGQ